MAVSTENKTPTNKPLSINRYKRAQNLPIVNNNNIATVR